jgi:signal transduction histidine kinase
MIEKNLDNERLIKSIILNSADNGMIFTNQHNEIILYNKAAKKYFKKDIQPIGMVFEESIALVDTSIDDTYDMENNSERDGLLFHIKNGESDQEIIAEYTLLKIDEEENLSGNLILLSDVTYRHSWIKQMLRNKEESEERGRMKNLFFANVSHEFKTPLTSILGYTDILLNCCRDSKNSQMLLSIKRSAQLINEFISDILLISKLDKGFVKIQISKFKSREFFLEIFSMFSLMVFNKNVDFKHNELDKNYFITTDRVRLKQIIINILSNSVKHTANGEIKIDISFDYLSTDRPKLKISISDSGGGIAPSIRSKIFEPFITTATKDRSGTGLGLYITKKLVTLLGGEISYTPLEGGTQFDISIPVEIDSIDEEVVEDEMDERDHYILETLTDSDKIILKNHKDAIINLSKIYDEKVFLEIINSIKLLKISEDFNILLEIFKNEISKFNIKQIKFLLTNIIGEMGWNV